MVDTGIFRCYNVGIMKKIICFLLVISAIFCLWGCSSNKFEGGKTIKGVNGSVIDVPRFDFELKGAAALNEKIVKEFTEKYEPLLRGSSSVEVSYKLHSSEDRTHAIIVKEVKTDLKAQTQTTSYYGYYYDDFADIDLGLANYTVYGTDLNNIFIHMLATDWAARYEAANGAAPDVEQALHAVVRNSQTSYTVYVEGVDKSNDEVLDIEIEKMNLSDIIKDQLDAQKAEVE